MLTYLSHPVLSPPSEDEFLEMDPEDLLEHHRIYHRAILDSERDPFRFGFVLPNWERAKAMLDGGDLRLWDGREIGWDERLELWVFGGNRSGKSRFSAWMVMNALVRNPGTRIVCWSQNQEASNLNQQPYLWEFMPLEFRRKQKDAVAKINYSKAGGFTENQFILPNGSQCLFKFYTQYEQDSSIVEGMELGALPPRDGSALGWTNVGNWFDEYLGGPELLETMRLRLATRNAKNLVTFTPIDGYTETIRQVLEKSRVVEYRTAELLKNERVQFIVAPENPIRGVIHFFSEDNPFGGYDRIKQELAGEPRDKILTRAYGVAVRSATSKFPLFSREINVVDPGRVPKPYRTREGMVDPLARFHVVDPAGRKNWFMLWCGVDQFDNWWVYREWPGVDIGEWGEWKSGKWKPGLGAKGLGYGIKSYVKEILELEGGEWDQTKMDSGLPMADQFLVFGEEIVERIIDPRLGAAKYATREGESSIIQELEEEGLVFVPAPGLHEEDGIQSIQDKMYFDNSREVDGANRPQFYISSDCENTILAIAEYTGEGGKDEPWKDPIDCLRYLGVSGISKPTLTPGEAFTAQAGY